MTYPRPLPPRLRAYLPRPASHRAALTRADTAFLRAPEAVFASRAAEFDRQGNSWRALPFSRSDGGRLDRIRRTIADDGGRGSDGRRFCPVPLP